MHFALALLVAIIVWRKGVWREWSKYHTTMMFFAVGNVTYNFLTANYFLWKMKPDFFPNHSITEMIYSFITFPSTALLFLSAYPESDTFKAVIHHVKWILIYVLIEWFFTTNDRMIYQHGWNLWWSAAFDVTMFPILRLHHKRPILTYGISVVLCVFWIWMFDVPVNVPIEQRHG
ncbi:CBO0543 family protein [Paenibacillus hexagrammi]|uniref:Uncharacterized protein n=1 Tax=Paenibacillus hexagrammi TaxID=2908839 RepID=A0ABY3SDG7_9BACL|nr:CBO0543 family protein [Paenibacillus sp. YPD9-1]UJF31231.1 hypothetical protein L0M14_15240 [Paenibacillus sp. YPD9-1]